LNISPASGPECPVGATWHGTQLADMAGGVRRTLMKFAEVSLLRLPRTYRIVGTVLVIAVAVELLMARQPSRRFGGAYLELDERRQQIVGDWVARFSKVTGQRLDARSFYDDILSLSTKTTFDAVTHALMTTPLTDASGQRFGDGLSLIERVESHVLSVRDWQQDSADSPRVRTQWGVGD
jgi:hypothetical protein